MKKYLFLISVLLLIPYLYSYGICKQALTTIVEECQDGTQATRTFLDTDCDGKFDTVVERNCNGKIHTRPIVIVEATGGDPIPVSGPYTNIIGTCSSGDDPISTVFYDSSYNIICFADRHCDNDTVFVVVPPTMSTEDNIVNLIDEKIEVTYINSKNSNILFYVSAYNSGNAEIVISDLEGNVIKEFNQDLEGKAANRIEISDMNLPSGVYFITVKQNNILKSTKFVITK